MEKKKREKGGGGESVYKMAGDYKMAIKGFGERVGAVLIRGIYEETLAKGMRMRRRKRVQADRGNHEWCSVMV